MGDTHCLLMNPIICPGGADTMACSLQHLHICQVALQQTHVVPNGQYTLEDNGLKENYVRHQIPIVTGSVRGAWDGIEQIYLHQNHLQQLSFTYSTGDCQSFYGSKKGYFQ